MNEFEKRMNALRLQHKAERVQIRKDFNRTIGHLNTAIGMVNSREAREALRAEKTRVYEAYFTSLKYSRKCYLQQIEILNDEYYLYRKQNPSNRELRRMMAQLCKAAEAKGQKTLSLAFGDARYGEITFN